MTERKISLSKPDYLEIDGKKVSHLTEDTVLDTLQKDGKKLPSFCGGMGKCGRCRIRFLEQAPLPSAMERSLISPKDLREGVRLACVERALSGARIATEFVQDKSIDIVEYNRWPEHITGYSECKKPYIAMDIGTTTVVMQLIDPTQGKIVAAHSFMNPQAPFGEDVMKRMEYAMSGEQQAEQIRDVLIEKIAEGIELLRKENTSDIDMEQGFIAANTTMIHLLMHYPVETMAKAPFVPHKALVDDLELAGVRFTILPAISAFVGGDVLAGMWALQMQDTTLLIDLGTNGEMVLSSGGKLYATSTAAGPAFMGGALSGLVGTDMIHELARLLDEGKMDETGLLMEPWFSQGVSISSEGENGNDRGVIMQEDIRQLQMAKAAVSAGIDLLLKKANITYDQVDQVWLAGGFGYYLSIAGAVRIGLIPKQWERCCVSVGNSALLGAALAGWRMDHVIDEMEAMKCKVSVINLAMEPEFNEQFIKNMNF